MTHPEFQRAQQWKLSLDIDFEAHLQYHRSFKVLLEEPMSITVFPTRRIVRVESMVSEASITGLSAANEAMDRTYKPSIPCEVY